MKKSLLFVSALLIGATSGFSQAITNSGFETWTSGSPAGWAVTAGTATQATAAAGIHGGTSSLLLTSTTLVPGIAVSGANAMASSTSVTGGFSYTLNPVSIKCYVKYVPATNDSATIAVTLTKWVAATVTTGTVTGVPAHRAIVGFSKDTLKGFGWATIGLYSKAIHYNLNTAPDSCQIVFKSSINAPMNGSKLYVDDVTLVLPAPPVVLACTVDPNLISTGNAVQILPDTGTVIIANKGQTFTKTFSIYMPTDAVLAVAGQSIGAHVDSVHLEDLTDIFAGFTKTCGLPSCFIIGGTVGCFTISGTMPMTDNILYKLPVKLNPYGTITNPGALGIVLHVGDDIQAKLAGFGGASILPALATYSVTVGTPAPPVTIGITTFDANGQFDLSQNKPNPFDGSTVINFNCPVSGKVDFKVVDVLGRQVYDTNINAAAGSNSFTFSTDLSNGTYFFSVSDGTNTITKKMVITGE